MITSQKNHRRSGTRLRTLLVAVAVATASLTGLAATAGADSATADTTSATGGLFVPLQQRIYDTRTTTYAGNTGNKLAVGKWYPVAVAGIGGAPSSGISAVQVTLTEVNGDPDGTLKADATGVSSPNTTVPSLMWGSGKESNAATIPVGADGKFQIFVTASTDIAIDLQGYYKSGSTAAGGYVPGTNKKILGSSSTRYAKGDSVTLPVAGTDQVPANASAVMLSILVIPTDSAAGNLQVYPSDTPPTSPWLLNWDSNENSVFTSAVGLGASGNITIKVANGTAALQVAVQGYFTPTSGTSKAGAFTTDRARPLDTRTEAALAPGETRTFQVAGRGGLPEVGSGIVAVAANLVIYPGATSSSAGSVLVSADDAPENFWAQFFYPGQKVSGFAVTALGADGGIKIHNSSSGAVDVLLDVEGWYSGIAAPEIKCPAAYKSGGWSDVTPDESVPCEVTAPSLLSPTDVLRVSEDGQDYIDVPLNDAGGTSQAAFLDNFPGKHSLSAQVIRGSATSPVRTFSYGFGNWASHGLTTSLTTNDQLVASRMLNITSDGDWLPDGAKYEFRVFNADGSTQLSSGSITSDLNAGEGDWVIPSGALQADADFSWNVTVSAPSGSGATLVSVTSPTWNFHTAPAEMESAGVRVCLYQSAWDRVHYSGTPPATMSVHGFWFAKNENCKGLKAIVTTQLQRKYVEDRTGSFKNIGAPGKKTVYAGGGSANRSVARYVCKNTQPWLYRVQVDVNLVGILDPTDKPTGAQYLYACG